MRASVGTHQARAIDRKEYRQILDSNVVHNLIIGALCERRIDRHHWVNARTGQPRGKRHRVLLSNGHIAVAFGKSLFEFHQTGAFAHRGRNRIERLVTLSCVADPV